MNEPANLVIISDEAPQSGTAGGLLLRRLLVGYPPERLRVLTHFVPTIGEPLPGVAYRHLSPPWRRFERSRFNKWMRTMRAYGLAPTASEREIERLLEGFRPDVVLCVMQHCAYFDSAHSFARRRGLPLAVIVHDVNEAFEPVLAWAKGAARRRDGEFYRFASARFCISPEMVGFCAEAYGAPGTVLYPNRSEELFPQPLENCEVLRSPPRLTLGFAGNLNFGYGEGILKMLPAVRAAGARVVMYGRPPAGAAEPLKAATDCCELRPFEASGAAWEKIKSDCDAVWLPYSFGGGQMESLYSHHFPSKLPEYLALGMPVIVTGPEYATGMRWARRNLGKELCAGDTDELANVIRSLQADGGVRRSLAERCIQAGERDFAPGTIVAKFRDLLQSTAVGPR